MKMRVAAFVSVLALSGVPVVAQAAPQLDPAAVQATGQMLEAMHARAMMVQTIQSMERVMPAQMRASLAGTLERDNKLSPQQKADALSRFDKLQPEMAARTHALVADPTLIDEMLTEMVPLYASTYTVDEIHQLTAFYASPVGQKMMATTPKLMGQVMEMSSRLMQPRLAKLMAGSAPAPNGQ